MYNYCIRPNYHTYLYKHTVKQFHSLQITSVYFLSTFFKAYTVGTHFNCIDLSMQFRWVLTTYAFIKIRKNRINIMKYVLCWPFLKCIPGPDKSKKNPLAHWASKFFFHLPSSNSYLPRICAAQIPICPRFANRNRSPTFNIALTSLWKQYSCKSQLIYRKARF